MNGLSAAIELARAGIHTTVIETQAVIGGGAHSAELTLPGFIHDVCSAVHPLAIGSPVFQSYLLGEHGIDLDPATAAPGASTGQRRCRCRRAICRRDGGAPRRARAVPASGQRFRARLVAPDRRTPEAFQSSSPAAAPRPFRTARAAVGILGGQEALSRHAAGKPCSLDSRHIRRGLLNPLDRPRSAGFWDWRRTRWAGPSHEGGRSRLRMHSPRISNRWWKRGHRHESAFAR